MKLIVAVVEHFAEFLFPSGLGHGGLEVVLHLLLDLVVGHLHAVDHSFVHKQFVYQHVLEQGATFFVSVLHPLVQTNLRISLFYIGMSDNVFTHHGNNTVHDLPFLGMEHGTYCRKSYDNKQFLHHTSVRMA